MITGFEDRLEQLFLDIDDLLSDISQQVKEASLEVLDFKTHAALIVPAYTEAKQKLNELEKLYIKLKITKEEYEEYYKSPTKDSN